LPGGTDKLIPKKAKYVFTLKNLCAIMYLVKIADLVKIYQNSMDIMLFLPCFHHFTFVVFYQLFFRKGRLV